MRKALLPERASWLPDLEAELFSFPGSRHDPRVAAFLIAYVGNGLVDAAVTATLEKSATVVVVVYGFRGKETGGRPGECSRINQLEKGRRETSRDRGSRTFALRRKRSENGIGQR